MTDTIVTEYLHLVVAGKPAPQGSKKGFVHPNTGRVILREQIERVGPWRESIKHEALAAVDGPPLDEPLAVAMVFAFARPQSHYRTGRNAHLLRDGAPIRPSGTPDLSKLARAAEDALTDAAVWRDDARVVEYLRLAKVWAGEDPDGPDIPGVDIRIWRMSEWRRAEGVVAVPGTLFEGAHA